METRYDMMFHGIPAIVGDTLGVSDSMRVANVVSDRDHGLTHIWVRIGDDNHGGRRDFLDFLQRERQGRFCESVMAGQSRVFGDEGRARADNIRSEMEKGRYFQAAKICAPLIEGCIPECRQAMKGIVAKKRPLACVTVETKGDMARMAFGLRGFYAASGWNGDPCWGRFPDSGWKKARTRCEMERLLMGYLKGRFGPTLENARKNWMDGNSGGGIVITSKTRLALA